MLEDSTMSEGQTTTNHEEIRQWAEERDGVPAHVKGTGSDRKGGDDDPGILRIDFEPRDPDLEEISWDEFFEKFDKEKLAFLYQDETADGKTSRFHKFINRPKSASGGKSASASKSSGTRSESASKGSGGAKSVGASKSAAKKKAAGSKS
jgi:hypothetical protein